MTKIHNLVTGNDALALDPETEAAACATSAAQAAVSEIVRLMDHQLSREALNRIAATIRGELLKGLAPVGKGRKLSKAQAGALSAVLDAAPSGLDVSTFAPATVRVLRNRGWVVDRADAAGVQAITITPAGRAALADNEDPTR